MSDSFSSTKTSASADCNGTRWANPAALAEQLAYCRTGTWARGWSTYGQQTSGTAEAQGLHFEHEDLQEQFSAVAACPGQWLQSNLTLMTAPCLLFKNQIKQRQAYAKVLILLRSVCLLKFLREAEACLSPGVHRVPAKLNGALVRGKLKPGTKLEGLADASAILEAAWDRPAAAAAKVPGLWTLDCGPATLGLGTHIICAKESSSKMLQPQGWTKTTEFSWLERTAFLGAGTKKLFLALWTFTSNFHNCCHGCTSFG